MTTELEKFVNINAIKKCREFNQNQCEQDDDCQFSTIEGFGCGRKQNGYKNETFNTTVPSPHQNIQTRIVKKSLETKNLKYDPDLHKMEIKLTAENIQCLDWNKFKSTRRYARLNIMQNEDNLNNHFEFNNESNTIRFIGGPRTKTKDQGCLDLEFVKSFVPYSLDGDELETYKWVSLPSVGAPIIGNDTNTISFEIQEPQFKMCENKIKLKITCYDANNTKYPLGPFNGMQINVQSLQEEEYERCEARAYIDASFEPPERENSPLFLPSGEIYDSKSDMKIVVTLSSTIGGISIALLVIGIINYISLKFTTLDLRNYCVENEIQEENSIIKISPIKD